MPATVKGIYHDLQETTYSISIEGVEYFFSSIVYRRKFKEGYLHNREKYEWFFSGKGLELNFNALSDFQFYCMIERRGFRVKIEGIEANWQTARKRAIQKLQ